METCGCGAELAGYGMEAAAGACRVCIEEENREHFLAGLIEDIQQRPSLYPSILTTSDAIKDYATGVTIKKFGF